MKKGFTLLELLIVIGILAILSTTMILVINPAQLLKKARDSQRISDLNTMKTAIAYYVTNYSSPVIGAIDKTYSDVNGAVCDAKADGSTSTASTVDGNGWLPIDFTDLTEGSPIGALPRDPAQTASGADPARYYVYLVASATNYTFQLVANMESSYYSNGGPGDVEQYDGGTIATLYEVGTANTTLATTSANCYLGSGQ